MSKTTTLPVDPACSPGATVCPVGATALTPGSPGANPKEHGRRLAGGRLAAHAAASRVPTRG